MMVFAMIVSFRISRDISLIFLAVIPILGVLLLLIVRQVNPIFKNVFQTYDGLNNRVQENIRGIRVVKSFNQENGEIKKFRGISERIYQEFARGERLLAFNSPLMQLFMYACMILISWLGAKAILVSGNDPALGVVLQDVNLFTGTVMENIRYGNPDATDDDCIAAARLANADGFIRMLPEGYQTLLQGDGSGLSQGQRQLISHCPGRRVQPACHDPGRGHILH